MSIFERMGNVLRYQTGDRRFARYDETLFQTLYENLSAQQHSLLEYAVRDKEAIRRTIEKFHVSRPNFVKDTERILNCKYFNRYADKTQVFSLYKNDDITRRILHVQIVSRIARNIGRMLNLNQDLIECIALGHDLGHTPFGHAGERFLSRLYHAYTGRFFNHNVQSVRILDQILGLNLSLQTLDGILCHNGEKVNGTYRPHQYRSHDATAFLELEQKMEHCYCEEGYTDRLVPSTLEGCVVRISDIIAYLGKDRQDARILNIELENDFVENEQLGASNSEFIANIIANLVGNSYDKDYLRLDEECAVALAQEKDRNFELIYKPQDKIGPYPVIKLMFEKVYEKLLQDMRARNESSPIYRHHINNIYRGMQDEELKKKQYLQEEENQIVVDYIASMTDDYFIELYEYLFPGTSEIRYKSYFSK